MTFLSILSYIEIFPTTNYFRTPIHNFPYLSHFVKKLYDAYLKQRDYSILWKYYNEVCVLYCIDTTPSDVQSPDSIFVISKCLRS